MQSKAMWQPVEPGTVCDWRRVFLGNDIKDCTNVAFARYRGNTPTCLECGKLLRIVAMVDKKTGDNG